MLLIYGFVKIVGAQFNVGDWLLDEPIGDISGFWLTWYFFGYSTGYKISIGLIEILGGLLLLFPKTAFAGALTSLAVMINIILIDIFFEIDSSALLMALAITMCLIIVLVYHRQKVGQLFSPDDKAAFHQKSQKRSVNIFTSTTRIIVIVFPIIISYWSAQMNNRNPTVIDGTWDVQQTESETDCDIIPKRMYFEHNQAYTTRFRYTDSLSNPMYFEVATNNKTLDIWETWSRSGEKIFSGTFDLQDNKLILDGNFYYSSKNIVLTLKRVR